MTRVFGAKLPTFFVSLSPHPILRPRILSIVCLICTLFWVHDHNKEKKASGINEITTNIILSENNHSSSKDKSTTDINEWYDSQMDLV